jgi:hypothetical protein
MLSGQNLSILGRCWVFFFLNNFHITFHRIVFGMSKEGFRRILDMVQEQLAGERDDNPVDLLPIHKLAIFLQFLRTNSFQKSVGSQHHIRVAKSVVCNNVNNVAKVIAGFVPEVVTFPDVEESKHIANEIFQERDSPKTLARYFYLCVQLQPCFCSLNRLFLTFSKKNVLYKVFPF